MHAPLSLTTALLFALPFTKGPYIQELGSDGVTVKVEVEPAQPVTVEVSGDGDAGQKRIESKETRAFHAVRVGSLSPGQKYTYTVRAGKDAQSGTFTTAPPNDATSSFTFLAYGDNRTDPTAHTAVTRAMLAVPAAFLVHTGDFVEDGRDPDDWKRFFEAESALLRNQCVFACVGNHELIDTAGESYLRFFGPTPSGSGGRDEAPRFYGTFRWQNARFFLLNGQDTFVTGPEIDWLRRELDKAQDEAGLAWRIVVVHFGYRSAGPHGDNPRLLAAGVDKLFRDKKVDLVISGHDHLYERGLHEGMRYVVSGGGGAPLYRARQKLSSTLRLEETYHFAAFDVSAVAIKLKAIRVDGSTLDACSFGKKPGWDCDEGKTAPASAPLPAPPKTETPSRATSACGCRGAGANPSGLEWPAALASLVASIFAWRRRSRS